MFKYIATKKEQLEKNGEKHHTLNFTAKLNPKTFVDFMLGLSGPLDAFNIRSHKVRYGISTPTSMGSSEGKISVQPNPFATGKLIVRGRNDECPAVLDVQVFVPPPIALPDGYFKFLLKSDLIAIEVTRDADDGFDRVAFATNDGFFQKHKTLDQWKNLWQMLSHLQGGGASLELLPDKNTPLKPIRFPPSLSSEVSENDGNIGLYLELCKKVVFILERLGGCDDFQMTMKALSESGNPLSWLYAVLTNEETDTAVNFKIPFDSRLSSVTSRDAILLGCIPLDELNILYSVKVSLSVAVDDDTMIWTAVNPSLLKIRGVLNDPSEFARFSQDLKAEFAEMPFVIGCDERFNEPLN
jgi:hypothetical protein